MHRDTLRVMVAGALLAPALVLLSPPAAPAQEPAQVPAPSSATSTATPGPARTGPPPTSARQSVASLETSTGADSVKGRIYVPVTDENAVYVIDPSTHTVIKKIANVGMHPIVLRATPDQTKVYVDNFGPLQGQITVIDTATNAITKKIMTFGPAYASAAMAPDGKFIYVPTAFSVVHKIDTATDRIVKTFPIAFLPIDLEVTPDSRSFYAFAVYGTVARYSAATGVIERPSISVKGLAPGWAEMLEDGSALYAINFLGDNVVEIDTQAWRAGRTVQLPTGSWPLSATLNNDETEMWVANIGPSPSAYNITIIDMATFTVSRVIKTATAPAYVGFSPDGKHAYVSDLGEVSNVSTPTRPLFYSIFYLLPPGVPGRIVDYDAQTKEVLGSTEVGTGPVAGVYF